MRYNLSYRQASDNSNRKATAVYHAAVAAGATKEEAQQKAFEAFEAEMKFYESEG